MFVTSDRCRRHDVKHRIDRVEFVPKLRYFLPGCIPLPVKRSPYCSASTRAVRMSRLGEVSHTYEGSSSPETIRRYPWSSDAVKKLAGVTRHATKPHDPKVPSKALWGLK